MRQSIATREIISPKILITDHNTINKKGGYPNRLVITAIDFIKELSKIGYIRIKKNWKNAIVSGSVTFQSVRHSNGFS